ncbi:MAG: hypothetical protein HGA35_07315, partial [Erysipelotrichaceae bacterium]|nr:hypothetical protein [Erysipelotrichaceae bacterium]
GDCRHGQRNGNHEGFADRSIFYPSGLLVGTVNHVENLPNAIGLKILVKPAADFYHLNYVAVVKRGNLNE